MLPVAAMVAKAASGWIGDRAAARIDARMKHRDDEQLEQFRAALQRAAIEHEVRFSRLHERRAEVLAEVYRRLTAVSRDVERVVHPAAWASEPTKDRPA